MTVQTNGPIRGLLARWVMRLEAAGSILRMAFLGVTAASTLTSALALIGLQSLAPYALVVGIACTLLFAYGYVEYGIYNRKNRENAEYGRNFARPDMLIDDKMTAAAVFSAVHGREPTEEEMETMESAVETPYRAHRNGVDIE